MHSAQPGRCDVPRRAAALILTLAVGDAAIGSGGPDFDNDGYEDLAIGAPTEDYRSAVGPATPLVDVGAVDVLYGSATGLTSDRPGRFSQNTPADLPGDDDNFGSVLVWGDFAATATMTSRSASRRRTWRVPRSSMRAPYRCSAATRPATGCARPAAGS